MTVDLTHLLISPDHSIRRAMACIDCNGKGIVMVVDSQQRLIATVTDGDIRRMMLAGADLDLPVKGLLEKQALSLSPITALKDTPETELLHLMTQHSIRQIPLLDADGRVVDLAMLGALVRDYELPLRAVVMAGGFGTRLHPLTEKLPKPMLPVGDRPLLELLIQQLQQAGIRRVNLTTHYKGDVIEQHFGDGRGFGVEIQYVEEKHPLGTAGSLSLLDQPQEPMLVINGDILTKLDFRALLDFHNGQKADMTVAVRQHEFQIPYGVVETDGTAITGIVEKPLVPFFINAGIYLLNPEICQAIPSNQRYDMPTLINNLIAQGHRVVSFPIREYWLDIGQMADYQKAQADVAQGEF